MEQNQQIKYLLISGGADSIASFKTYLDMDPANSGGLICIYYEMTDTLRAQAEFECVSQLASRYPQFTFFHSKLRGFGYGDALGVVTAFVDNYIVGVHQPDADIVLYMGLEREERDEYGSNLKEYQEMLKYILMARKAYKPDEKHPKITLESLVVGLEKNQMVSRCGDDEFWTCRFPQITEGHIWDGCGTCHSCRQLAEVGLIQPRIKMFVDFKRMQIMPENPKYEDNSEVE